MDSLGECLRFLKAKRKDKLVSPTEHVMTDEHEKMNEQLKPFGRRNRRRRNGSKGKRR